MTINMYIATFTWLLLTIGLVNKRRKNFHVFCMVTGILIDIGLVLYLQLTREAIQIAVSFEPSMLEMIHIAFSTIALLLYFPVLALGAMLNMGKIEVRDFHIKIAASAYVFRTLGFIFMFSMLQ